MNFSSYFLILFSIATLLISTNAESSRIESLSKRHPEDKCGGKRMFYTPLIRRSDEEEIAVCDSSCSPIQSVKLSSSSPGAQRRMHKKQARRRAITESEFQQSTSIWQSKMSNLYTCDDTKTWPEEGIPENVKDNFPFNMRTCFYDQADTDKEEFKAQNTFEQACKAANGVFTRPLHHSW
ncbi:uncharacterized protein FA14DRAFT_10040 [Meira miltonrushii]|uniref:Uncharacterized protein n=1 Tax=Meira miltonrushii TaxID=1280837 RepID=A0A316VHJ3_9BASI|nr:uncharacterized protein FA14DRAFT_10040 [Meira miltonrushii]PWN37109.1 hypothetical protein FA14DRAFT_10040 [Meira miltonrushii]